MGAPSSIPPEIPAWPRRQRRRPDRNPGRYDGAFGPANWERALALGIYLHGLSADDATASRAEAALLSGEIAEHLPETYRRFVAELQQRA